MSSNFSVSALSRVFNDSSHDIRGKVIGLYILLIGFNIIAWILAFAGFAVQYPALLGVALLAYTFGLRHSVDADHISAIDNVTRKLMQENKRPVGVGFFFSLGHSTVVVLIAVLVGLGARAISAGINDKRSPLQTTAGLIGTSVSAFFLLTMALINIVILVQIVRAFHQATRGGGYDAEKIDDYLSQRGFFARIFRGLFKTID